MGYTHYWYRKVLAFDKDRFKAFSEDCQRLAKLMPYLNVQLAGGNGEGEPVITEKEICINGVANCGHEKRNLGITWAAKNASGVATIVKKQLSGVVDSELLTQLKKLGFNTIVAEGQDAARSGFSDSDVSGTWFAGAELTARTCGGDCSHESFFIPQKFSFSGQAWKREDWIKKQEIFDFCKTAYKPYDLFAISALALAKHHLGKDIQISSDGTEAQWEDGLQIIEKAFGYSTKELRGDLRREE